MPGVREMFSKQEMRVWSRAYILTMPIVGKGSVRLLWSGRPVPLPIHRAISNGLSPRHLVLTLKKKKPGLSAHILTLQTPHLGRLRLRLLWLSNPCSFGWRVLHGGGEPIRHGGLYLQQA